jgi:hypothetical protein
MKDYARFLVKSRAPIGRSQDKGDLPATPDVAPESEPAPKLRAFDKARVRRTGSTIAHGAYAGYPSPAKKESQSPSLSELAARNTSPTDVTAIPDSWPVKDHWGEEPPAPERSPSKPFREEEPETKQRPGPKKKMKHKRRKVAMSISVSEEEEFILRTYAAKRNQSFSAWARTTMFRAMGRKIPDRL